MRDILDKRDDIELKAFELVVISNPIEYRFAINFSKQISEPVELKGICSLSNTEYIFLVTDRQLSQKISKMCGPYSYECDYTITTRLGRKKSCEET